MIEDKGQDLSQGMVPGDGGLRGLVGLLGRAFGPLRYGSGLWPFLRWSWGGKALGNRFVVDDVDAGPIWR